MIILILGGCGVFGGRLAQLLSGTDLHILIAGRDLAKARAFCAAHPATGPFQYDGPLSVLQACIASHTNDRDFADFVSGVSQFDAAANAAGIFALSGTSSFPVLTAALLREMAKTMDITHVTGGIAPSPHAAAPDRPGRQL